MAGSRKPRPSSTPATPTPARDAPVPPPGAGRPAPPPGAGRPPPGAGRPLPTPRGWYVMVCLDGQGNRVNAGTPGAVGVLAVCVHRMLPTATADRLRFVEAAVAIAAAAAKSYPVLIVLPGGFFGFDAEVWWQGGGDPWTGLAFTGAQALAVRSHIQTLVDGLPKGSAIAFGSDTGGSNAQQALCVIQHGVPSRVISRTSTPLAARHVQVGGLRATVFVCGEFTGSPTDPNGPYFGTVHLDDAAADLPGTGLLVDLAHAHVRGTVDNNVGGPRNVHQRQMEAFSAVGASALVHHHDGALVANGSRVRCDTASNWLMFRGGMWVNDDEVHQIP